MATQADLRETVLNDVKRTDLTAEASAAIVAAVRFYEHRRWADNEEQYSLTTTSTTSTYTLPTNFRGVDYVEAEYPGNNWQEVRPRSYTFIKHLLEGSTVAGYPEHYAIRNKSIIFGYQPNSDYHVRIYYKKSLEDMSAAASNTYTNELAPLIGARASYLVAMNIMHDVELANIFKQIETETEVAMATQHDQRTDTRYVKPYY